MVRRQRAVVVPRVLSEISGEPFALEEMVAPYLDKKGAIAILGPMGSGKTTALHHLAAALRGRITFFDEEARRSRIRRAGRVGLAVYARPQAHQLDHLATLELAPWGTDEALEYMMAVHPDACGEVMPRVVSDPGTCKLGGIAELWCAVLDRMAAGTPTVTAALVDVATRAALGDRISRHQVVRILRRAHELAFDIRNGPGQWPALGVRQERDVIREAAALLAGNTDARNALARLCDGPADERQPMAASLLVALDPGWVPRGVPLLKNAYLRGVRWRAVDLREARLVAADLAGANLDAAVFDKADASLACLRGARLRGTSFRKAYLVRADLRAADLAGAALPEAKLSGADLRGAKLMGADLSRTSLLDTRLDGTDLSGADLSGARCWGLDLRRAVLDGANFSAALLEGCHLDGVRLRGAKFDHARLREAFLTGSVLPKACFRDADLTGARVADVSWEGADLRGADFRKAIFHMGSSRNGLVDSFLASEGTRTGFYTDDYDEQYFKAPEEIRKANLRGADLRGADVLGTDFYLVDLRDALYDEDQEVYFRHCRAILHTKRI